MPLTLVSEQARAVRIVTGTAEGQKRHRGVVGLGKPGRRPADPLRPPVLQQVLAVGSHQLGAAGQQITVVKIVHRPGSHEDVARSDRREARVAVRQQPLQVIYALWVARAPVWDLAQQERRGRR